MAHQEISTSIGHADEAYPHRHSRPFEVDRNEAKTHLDAQYPEYEMNDTLASAVAVVAKSERSRRNSHYYRYRATFGIAGDERLFEGVDNLVETSLFDFDSRIRQMTPQQLESARVMGGKGISAELGHVDQLGDWTAGARLDEQIRLLPHSEELDKAGFVFADTYGDKSLAKISYKIQIADEFQSEDDDSSYGVALKGVRKRAAADVLTERGDAYEIVKLSTFVIHAAQLGREYLEAIDEILTLSKEKDTAHLAPAATHKVGKEIIEPFITHPEFRSLSPGLIAVSSLYFALHRAK